MAVDASTEPGYETTNTKTGSCRTGFQSEKGSFQNAPVCGRSGHRIDDAARQPEEGVALSGVVRFARASPECASPMQKVRHTRIIVTHYGGPEALRVVEEECPEPNG